MAVERPHATDAEEEYLQTLFWLCEAGLPMTGANVARAMQLSAPTVSEMMGRLERGGFIERGADRMITFTDSGRADAGEIVSRHRMIERFLTDVVGVPWDDVHEEAEHLEHAMTPRFEAYVRASVGDAPTCPHGHPIRVGERVAGVPLADCELGATVTVLRFENEAEDLLHYLKDAGLEVGLTGTVAAKDAESMTVAAAAATGTAGAAAVASDAGDRDRDGNGDRDGDGNGERRATVTTSVAETVSVTADPSPEPRTALPEQLVLGQHRYGR